MNVLVYFDGRQRRVALRTVARLAEKFLFDVDILVHAPVASLEEWAKIVQGTVQELRAESPFEQAVEAACQAKNYDLVVAAPNDRRGLVRMILGSRIGRFVGAAPATIWVPRGGRVRLQRIVVGVSGGPQSEQDARLGARLAIAFDARLELVYVASQLPLFFATYDEFQDALQDEEQVAQMAPGVIELRRIYKVLKGEGVKVEMRIRSGIVADELVTVCQGYGKKPPADLLIFGAHAPMTYAGADYLENLASEIADIAPCPALVVHAESDWNEWVIAERDGAHP